MQPHPPPAGAGASPGQGGSCPDDALLVGLVEARLPAAMRLLGIDFSRLSDAVGHA